jgi:histidine triad (HIT) family protein
MKNPDIFKQYQTKNIFARIIRGQMECRLILETEHTMAFHDVFPVAPVHVLIIPKGKYIAADDFFSCAPDVEILDWRCVVAKVIDIMDIKESGYRLVCNSRVDGGQVIPHFHMHVLGKKQFGTLL